MNTPDKIFISFLEDDKDGQLCTEWETFPYPLALDNIEYIRKDALLEWAKKVTNNTNHSLVYRGAFRDLIDKLESL